MRALSEWRSWFSQTGIKILKKNNRQPGKYILTAALKLLKIRAAFCNKAEKNFFCPLRLEA